jgi:hypothetical protein
VYQAYRPAIPKFAVQFGPLPEARTPSGRSNFSLFKALAFSS